MSSPPTAREIATIFAALAQETRLEAYRLLLRYHPFGLAAGDISRLLSVPHNTLSTHLRALEAAGLVCSHRRGRSIIFAADPNRFSDAAAFLDIARCVEGRGRVRSAGSPAYPSKRPRAPVAEDAVYNVLFLCSGNSARSLIAEAILAREGAGRFRAFSGGSVPARRANSAAIDLLDGLGYDTAGLRPKSWDKFAEPGAPVMDFVITLCDRAAGEACPSLPGHPVSVHWGVPSLGKIGSAREQMGEALKDTYRRLMHRVTALINVPFERLSKSDIRARLVAIGAMEGATEAALVAADGGAGRGG